MLRAASLPLFLAVLATLTAAQQAAKPTAAQPGAAQPTGATANAAAPNAAAPDAATPAAAAEPAGKDPSPIAGNPKAATLDSHHKPTKAWVQWQPKATYAYEDLPDKYMGDARGKPDPSGGLWNQTGFNRCAQGEGMWHTNSSCQTAWINSIDDFCLWGPNKYGVEVGAFERESMAYCSQGKWGTRLIPDGTIKSLHFVQTPDYVQVTGSADFTSIGMVQGDTGGELDPHGADDLENPIGGVVYTTAHPQHRGKPYQITEWTSFISWNQFCMRACWGTNAAAQCQHIYDEMGCEWNIPANYGDGFESCEGQPAEPQGIYGTSTFHQGDPLTPEAHPVAPSSNCHAQPTIANKLLVVSEGQVQEPGKQATPTAGAKPTSGGKTVAAGSNNNVTAAHTAGAAGLEAGAIGYGVAALVTIFAGGAFLL